MTGTFHTILNSFLLRNIIIITIMIIWHVSSSMVYGPYPARIFFYSLSVELCIYPFYLFHNVYLYKVYLLHKRYVEYTLTLLASYLLYSAITGLTAFLYSGKTGFEPLHVKAALLWLYLFNIYVAFGVYFAHRQMLQRKKELELEKEERELELKQIKQQFNPGFIYNALNKIYEHNLQHNSDNNNELLLQLSELMRIITDNALKESISLREEVTFVEKYIAFEKLSGLNSDDISLFFYADKETYNIAPFSFFSLIEQSLSKTATKRIMTMHILAQAGRIYFRQADLAGKETMVILEKHAGDAAPGQQDHKSKEYQYG